MKLYYGENNEVIDVVKCCNKMNEYWTMDLMFLEPESLEIINREGVVFKRCPNCGKKNIVKPSRL